MFLVGKRLFSRCYLTPVTSCTLKIPQKVFHFYLRKLEDPMQRSHFELPV